MTVAWDDLPLLFPEAGEPERWLPLLRRHAALVEASAARVRVSSVPPDEVVRRQYAESLELLRVAKAEGSQFETIADIGSGGGFPGMVVAVCCPESDVHLVEPLQKRAGLLREFADVLGLQNVTVHPLRAEEAGRGPLRDCVDLVMARAVAELRELLEYTVPIARPGGLVALPKGSAFEAELAAAGGALTALQVEFLRFHPMRPAVSTTLGVALLRKLAPTPEIYPRRPGVPGRRPL